MVAINHRITLFGFCHLGDMGGETYAAAGKVGMLDLVQGLEGVRDNITQFGGDPDSVMLFGESGDGLKTSTLMAMPPAKGLFHRAAIQSGPLLLSNPRERADASARALLAALGMSENRVDDIQTIPAKKPVAAMATLSRRQGSRSRHDAATRFAPFVDGKILPAHLFDPVATPVWATVPLLMGWNTHEQAFFQMRDPSVFDLGDAGLRQRVVALAGEQKASQAIEWYERLYPGKSPTELFFLLATDRDARRVATILAERRIRQGQAPTYLYLFAWRTPALDGKLVLRRRAKVLGEFIARIPHQVALRRSGKADGGRLRRGPAEVDRFHPRPGRCRGGEAFPDARTPVGAGFQ